MNFSMLFPLALASLFSLCPNNVSANATFEIKNAHSSSTETRHLLTAQEILSWTLEFNKDCAADFAANGDVKVTCSFTGPEGGTNYAEIKGLDSCGDFTEYAGGSSTSSSNIVAELDITSEFTDEIKNSGNPYTLTFCIRADVYANDGTDDVHLLMKKAKASMTFTFPTESKAIDPNDVDADGDGGFYIPPDDGEGGGLGSIIQDIETTATYGSDVEAYRCLENGTRDQSNTALQIGDSLYFCIQNNDAGTDISSLTNVQILKSNNVVTTPIDADGNTNFITSKNCDPDKCVVSTLMTPAIFDQYQSAEDQSIVVQGVAGLTYVSRRGLKVRSARQLQQDEQSPFSVIFSLGGREGVPEVANQNSSHKMAAKAPTLLAVVVAGVATMF